MMESVSRRSFLQHSLKVGAASALLGPDGSALANPPAFRPIVIASGNGLRAVAKAMELIKSGRSALDAVIAGVNINEDDPEDMSVGYGGLPNEDGEVELDASVMDGLTCRAGAVGGLKHIKNPSKVARMVMERTDHIFLCGEGALRFALAHGFQKENLLTEKARKAWLAWKEAMSSNDNWLNEDQAAVEGAAPNGKRVSAHDEQTLQALLRTYGTINCCAIDLKGNLAGVTTTSGLSWKIAGRLGDSPIIGAGLYVDNEVGAAGSTGRGEANIKVCGGHTVVENMRRGMTPEQACLEVLERVVKTTKEKRLLDERKRPKFNLHFYAINRQGEFGSAALWSEATFSLHDGQAAKSMASAYLFKKS
ncbi:MAG: N(4)-(beta-N-acetylglucosaminyl)-L-asparaginase [Acidobacteria bacterium]|nr:N(4)-(beta-N-acetylglucosaminyl)-L-asparaginase [Acidobacteriota bacterium]MBI3655236.1 N(4)-(beta-N-acetylglucosaminyl)-L-asparaginase [Acidobacteriota bacterium]